MREFLYGNEAIARGAYDAGCAMASGYPGTPSTEIIETMARFRDIHVEWSTNEKVALEVAIGASLSGKRALATMKHVGLNVAADPLLTVSYMGVRGGLVIVSADDPGMHSSQNEQDNRWYGKFAKIPVLEPSDSDEAYRFTRMAFEISEKYDTAVIVRSTTRVSHARSLVGVGTRLEPPSIPYSKEMAKYVMLPANARRRKPAVLKRLQELKHMAENEETGLNHIEWSSLEAGVITGGIAYQYVKEALPGVSVLKLGMSYPLPEALIREFAEKVGHLFIVEELDSFWETEVKAMGIQCIGKEVFPEVGELNPGLVWKGVAEGLRGEGALSGPAPFDVSLTDNSQLPQRPPVLCPGCPHRGVFYVLKKLNLIVAGDIGCYTLGALPPLSSLDTTTCMGASIGHAQGMRASLPPEQAKKVVAVIGDSTFMHSGIAPLVNMTYNGDDAPVIILDNGTTAMTGHQGHPGSGLNVRREEAPKVSIEGIAVACGRKNVRVVSSYDLKAFEEAVRQALVEPSSVVIARTPCVLLTKARGEPPEFIEDLCVECGLCLSTGCPALESDGKRPRVNAALCTGCSVCAQVCPKGALRMPGIGKTGKAGDRS